MMSRCLAHKGAEAVADGGARAVVRAGVMHAPAQSCKSARRRQRAR